MYKLLINKELKQDYKTVYHVTITLSEAGELKSKDPVRLDTFSFVKVHYMAFSLGSYSGRIVKTVPRSSICYVLWLTWDPSTIESSRTKPPLHDIIQGDAWSNVLGPGTDDSVSLLIIGWSSGQKHYADDDQY